MHVHISGTDLVCDRPGHWMVLEDNLRVPSGMAYAVVNRRLLARHLPELHPPAPATNSDEAPQMLCDTLRAAAPPHGGDDAKVALMSAGWEDSAWFEHTFLAEEMGVPLVQPVGSVDSRRTRGAPRRHRTAPVDVLYVRMDEDMLLSSTGYDGAPLRPGLAARGG